MELVAQLSAATALSATAGMRAYIPLLIVGLIARFTDLITLRPPFDWLESWWVLVPLAVLALVEVLADKIPAVDTVHDVIETPLRVIAGAILFAAVIGKVHPALSLLAGAVIAGTVHAIKASARPAITASTAGHGNPVISFLGDVFAIANSFLALVLPILSLILIIFFLVLVFYLTRKLLGKYRKKTA